VVGRYNLHRVYRFKFATCPRMHDLKQDFDKVISLALLLILIIIDELVVKLLLASSIR
jgi:hypothetical protein